jgi:hypothetical protein
MENTIQRRMVFRISDLLEDETKFFTFLVYGCALNLLEFGHSYLICKKK